MKITLVEGYDPSSFQFPVVSNQYGGRAKSWVAFNLMIVNESLKFGI
jgi:hypothetical protein